MKFFLLAFFSSSRTSTSSEMQKPRNAKVIIAIPAEERERLLLRDTQPEFECDCHYHIALIFRGSKFSQLSRIRCHLQKYFNENFDTLHHHLLLVILQCIREIFSTKIVIRKNLDLRNTSAIRLSVKHP